MTNEGWGKEKVMIELPCLIGPTEKGSSLIDKL